MMVIENGRYGTAKDLAEIERTIFAGAFWHAVLCVYHMLKHGIKCLKKGGIN